MPVLPLPESTIGLIVRGKRSEKHRPWPMEQHADCFLRDGSPVGFFGGGGAASGGGASRSSGSTGANLQGFVADYELLRQFRLPYVDLETARKYGPAWASTVLTVQVDGPTAEKFGAFWRSLQAEPGAFYLLGNNCSTHANDAFRYAGVLSRGIPGLDTPANLYDQLIASPAKTASYSGYVGFSKRPDGTGFDITVEPLA